MPHEHHRNGSGIAPAIIWGRVIAGRQRSMSRPKWPWHSACYYLGRDGASEAIHRATITRPKWPWHNASYHFLDGLLLGLLLG